MDPSAGREQQVKYGGLVVAGVGFLLSRATLLVVIDQGGSPVAFLTTGFLPLSVGLALTAFGLSLAVSTFEPWYVNTVAAWTLAGTAGMGLVAALSAVNPMLAEGAMLATAQSSALVANTLIGGAVGGALIGVRSARNRRQRRTLARQSDQVVVLDRILRDEVLNAVAAIRAHAELVRDGGAGGEGAAAITRASDRIQDAVEDVGFLVRSGGNGRTGQEPTALAPAVREELAAVRGQFPGVTIDWDGGIGDDLQVRANDRLGTVVAQLCAAAVERHPERTPHIRVAAAADETAATVTVTDDGDPVTDKQAAVLTGRTISEHDDPSISFGYPIVSFLVDQYGGEVTAQRIDGRTRVTVSLPRVREGAAPSQRHGVEPAALRDVSVAALVAGVAMGAVLQAFANTIPVIGSLYGVGNVAVGWVAHLFHSVVFGVLFAAALRRPFLRDRVDSLATTVAAAVAVGLGLAVVAAGLVMPLWLNAIGVPASLPRVFPAGVLGHLVWGVVLGSVYWALSRH